MYGETYQCGDNIMFTKYFFFTKTFLWEIQICRGKDVFDYVYHFPEVVLFKTGARGLSTMSVLLLWHCSARIWRNLATKQINCAAFIHGFTIDHKMTIILEMVLHPSTCTNGKYRYKNLRLPNKMQDFAWLFFRFCAATVEILPILAQDVEMIRKSSLLPLQQDNSPHLPTSDVVG